MLVDSHCHLDFPEFDLAAVLARCQAAGVGKIVIPAVAQWNWARIAGLCATDARLYAAYGLHPLYLSDHAAAHIAALEAWLDTHAAVAVGECGLDYAVQGDRARQQWFFEAQLDVARRYDFAAIIHARQSLEEVLHTLKRFAGLRFVVHSFTGSDQQLERLFALGGVIGIGGTATYPRAQRLRRQIARLQAGQFVLETDAPDQPLFGRQGRMNEPYLTRAVAEEVARLQGVTQEEVARESSATVERLYKME